MVSRIAQAWLDTLVCLPTSYDVLGNWVAIPKRGSGPRAKLTRTRTDRELYLRSLGPFHNQWYIYIYFTSSFLFNYLNTGADINSW